MAKKAYTFEEALERLDVITKELNRSDVPLDKAMELFKEGLELSKQCEKQLKTFENEVNQLVESTEQS